MGKKIADIQAEYYGFTASEYDSQHLSHGDEHYVALHYLDGLIKMNGFKKILDLGAGTGRAAHFLKNSNPGLKVVSIEPIKKLREIGHTKGLSSRELRGGNMYKLEFKDSSFDLVCAFGVFHHLESPIDALMEMQRVSRNSIYISDSNNFGQGRTAFRLVKQILNFFKIWDFTVRIKTKGKRYTISAGDGLAYSFSLFSLLKHLKTNYSTYILGTVPSKKNLFKTASHIAIFAQKKL